MVTRKRKESNLPKWEVTGSGGLTLLDKRTFEKGDTFEAEEWDVPEAFSDSVIRLTPKEEIRVQKPVYKKEEVVASAEEQDKEDFVQLYNIVSEDGKTINEKPLPSKEIDKLLKELNK
jgi:hypothetical protein